MEQVCASGHAALDAELPGGGWPCGHLTEILYAQSGVLEWRLLAPMLGPFCQAEGTVVVIGPPRHPHPPGLQLMGVSAQQLVWVRAETPAERLWVTEQLLKANTGALVLSWLPQARPDQLRRLQVLAGGAKAPVFVCRPAQAAQESSPAPLRVLARVDADWALAVDILKRKGPPLARTLSLPSVPGGLQALLTPRVKALLSQQAAHGQPAAETVAVAANERPVESDDHVVVRTATGRSRRRTALAVRRA
ncbi:hypothetical protein NBRC116584_31500 [Hydrogenophaga sp. 5NK40-0174]